MREGGWLLEFSVLCGWARHNARPWVIAAEQTKICQTSVLSKVHSIPSKVKIVVTPATVAIVPSNLKDTYPEQAVLGGNMKKESLMHKY